ncbi:MAG: helix-turn-helix domain-containing protein [Mariprofundaceae bacterium]
MNEESQYKAEASVAAEAKNREALLIELGKRLSTAREEQGHSLEDVVSGLNLRKVYVQALESGRWEDMPGEVYAQGFLRQYASYLRLDMDADIQRIKSGEYALTKPLTFPDPPIAPNKTWSITAALVFVVLFILFNIFSPSDDTPEYQAVVPEQPPLVTAPVIPPVIEMSDKEAKPADTPQAETEPESSEQAEEQSVPTSLAITTDLSMLHHYLFEAVGDAAWLQIFRVNEQGPDEPELIREVLLQPGESLTLDNAAGHLLVTCGNAAALQISVDGRIHAEAGTLGESGKVLRHYRLVPSQVDAATQ